MGGVPIATNVVAVVVAHGANGLGAYPRDGQRIPAETGEEAANVDPAATTFYAGEGRDDLVIWVAPTLLMGRMLGAGKLS